MKQQILHTPEGVRDIYNIEYGKKHIIEEKLQNVFHLFGYQDIQTPMFEFFDVFGKEIGTIPSRELYKFFDRDGNTLVLRPDITPSIARAVATYYDTESLPIRLCYNGNTFINHMNYQGRLRENTQAGAELVGIDSVEADAEMIAIVVESLKSVGLKEFQIHIGCVEFFENLIRETGLNEESEQRLRELLKNKNYFGVHDLLEQEKVKVTAKAAFQVLPDLIGGLEVLKEAKVIALNTQALESVRRMEELYRLLEAYDAHSYITFDLSMSGTYGYYTGIIFQGYTYGTGDAIVKGGRYDNLLEKFGKKSPSIGFVFVVDELVNAITRQKIEIPFKLKNTFILYDKEREAEAIHITKEFRNKGKQTELCLKKEDVSLDDYILCAKRDLCVSMMYLKNTNEIEMLNLLTGKSNCISKTIK